MECGTRTQVAWHGGLCSGALTSQPAYLSRSDPTCDAHLSLHQLLEQPSQVQGQDQQLPLLVPAAAIDAAALDERIQQLVARSL